VVLPFLPAGELTRYVLLTSVAVLAGRLVLVGLDVELPLLVRGRASEALRFLPLVRIAWLVLPITGAVWALASISAASAAFLAASTAATLLVGGLARTVSPGDFERLQTLPWVLFGIVAAGGWLEGADEFVMLRAGCQLVAQFAVVARLRARAGDSVAQEEPLAPTMIRAFRRSWLKLLSNLGMIGMLRGLVIWPSAFIPAATLDPVAFAVACGEALWQFGMVFGHRRYARFARELGSGRRPDPATVKWAAVVHFGILGAAAVGCVQIAASWPGLPFGLDPVAASWAAVYYALLCSYGLMRFLAWALGGRDASVVVSQLALVVTLGSVVLTLPPSAWFPAAAAAAALLVLWTARSVRDAAVPAAGSAEERAAS